MCTRVFDVFETSIPDHGNNIAFSNNAIALLKLPLSVV